MCRCLCLLSLDQACPLRPHTTHPTTSERSQSKNPFDTHLSDKSAAFFPVNKNVQKISSRILIMIIDKMWLIKPKFSRLHFSVIPRKISDTNILTCLNWLMWMNLSDYNEESFIFWNQVLFYTHRNLYRYGITMETTCFSNTADVSRIFFGVLESKDDPNSMIGTMDLDTSTGDLSGRVRTRSDSNKQVFGKWCMFSVSINTTLIKLL